MDFKAKYQSYLDFVSEALEKYMDLGDCPQKTVVEAMKYSLLAGGKRLRPVLAVAVADLLEGDMKEALPFACAIEMIHTYSLIHDDLPAMDNDDYRRGRLTNHKVYGEAMAILAGDGLLNYAFEMMIDAVLSDGLKGNNKIKASKIVAKAAGIFGMIGGQVIDLESENKKIHIDLLKNMHRHKTGALIKAPIMASAEVFEATQEQKAALMEYGEKIGLAFQVKDDILDVEGDSEVLGKKAGSDALNQKSTFVTEYGLQESKEILDTLTNEAIGALDIFCDKAWFLKELAEYLVKRDN